MNQSDPARGQQSKLGCLLAPAIGIAVVMAGTGAFSLMTAQSLRIGEEWPIYLVQMLLVAAPFGLLALAGAKGKAPWLAGLTMTVVFWSYYFYDGIRYQQSGDTSGANIGLGVLMLLSPILIGGACGVVAMATRRRP